MKIKALAIILAFIICLILLLVVRQAIMGHFSIHHVDFYDNGADWNNYQFRNIVLNSDSSQLIVTDKYAQLASPPYKTEFPFNELILSWNCFAAESSGLSVFISISGDGQTWHDFAYQEWGYYPDSAYDKRIDTYKKKINRVGYVDTDIIKLAESAQYYKYALDFFHGDSLPFYLDRISVCYTDTSANARQFAIYGKVTSTPKSIALAVPFMSQASLPDSIADLTCSPTSVVMVLNYFDHQYSALEVCAAAYDPYAEIYGNWPHNIEAAYLLGLKKTWIGRHNSFGELADELNHGRPVIISVTAQPGELAGAPYKSTSGSGHLLVVRGFDDQGNVLVNDPAGGDPQDGMIVYDSNELTNVWIGHGGVAYHLWPEP